MFAITEMVPQEKHQVFFSYGKVCVGKSTFASNKCSSIPLQVGRKRINNQWMSEWVTAPLYFSTVNSKEMIRKTYETLLFLWNTLKTNLFHGDTKRLRMRCCLGNLSMKKKDKFFNKRSSLKHHKLCIETTASIMQLNPPIYKIHNNVKHDHLS